MSKELIDRLRDNRVTGFDLTMAACEAADTIERQAAQIALLLDYLRDAATSLETISVRSFGEESYLDSKPQIRGYAASRAAAARKAIASVNDHFRDATKMIEESK